MDRCASWDAQGFLKILQDSLRLSLNELPELKWFEFRRKWRHLFHSNHRIKRNGEYCFYFFFVTFGEHEIIRGRRVEHESDRRAGRSPPDWKRKIFFCFFTCAQVRRPPKGNTKKGKKNKKKKRLEGRLSHLLQVRARQEEKKWEKKPWKYFRMFL